MRSHRARRRVLLTSLIALALLVGLVAPAAIGAQTLRLRPVESGGLRFDKSRLVARHGRVTVVLTNARSNRLPHSLQVEGHGIEKRAGTVTPGNATRLTVSLKRGTYTYYCPVDAHRQAGMRGKLVVR